MPREVFEAHALLRAMRRAVIGRGERCIVDPMLRAVLLGSLVATPLLGDVVPRCGGPTISEQAPGEWCGHNGPSHRADCRPPAACYEVEAAGRMCTAECTSDSECAPLGSGFVCAAMGMPHGGDSSLPARRLCRPPAP